jgi:hypothetical protein
MYVEGNPINFVDPNGMKLDCPVGSWECKTVKRVHALKDAFLSSAKRHNRIPGMDDNGFAALIAAVIESERRIGRETKERGVGMIWLEDFSVELGCIVSGHFLKDAFSAGDFAQLVKYLTNQEIPQYATVGIGNLALWKADDLWKNQACGFERTECVNVRVNPLRKTIIFGKEKDITNPFGEQVYVDPYGTPVTYEPTKIESYQIMAKQLLNDKKAIEYIAANLEAGALRRIAKGLQPNAFYSATWHLKSVVTANEIKAIRWNPGGATYILNNIPTALTVLGLTSSWNINQEMLYINEAQEAFLGP